MNKKIIQIPGTKDEMIEKEKQKMSVYQELYDSFSSQTKKKKKIITCRVIGLGNNENTPESRPELKFTALCKYKDWRITIPALYMGFDKKVVEKEGLTIADKTRIYKAYIRKMIDANVDVVIKAINIEEQNALGSRTEAMESLVRQHYFKTDANGNSPMERWFKTGKIIPARVITISDSLVHVDIFGYITKILARNVEWRFVSNLRDVVSVGEVVPVKIMALDIDKENERVVNCEVSMKDAKPNMMRRNMRRYTEGSTFIGKVTGIRNGYYVQIGDFNTGIDIYCKIVNCDDMPNKGDRVLVTIGQKDEEHGRVFGVIEEIKNSNALNVA